MTTLLEASYDSTEDYEMSLSVGALGLITIDDYGYISALKAGWFSGHPAGPNISNDQFKPSTYYTEGTFSTGVVLSSMLYYNEAEGYPTDAGFPDRDHREIYYATNLGIEKDPWVRDAECSGNRAGSFDISYDSVELTRLLNIYKRYATYKATEGTTLSAAINTALSDMVGTVLDSTVVYTTEKVYKKTKRKQVPPDELAALPGRLQSPGGLSFDESIDESALTATIEATATSTTDTGRY